MRATALASDTGRALSGNMKSLMEMIANTLMKRTTTIARASGVGGLAAAAANAANEEKIAPKTCLPAPEISVPRAREHEHGYCARH